MSPADRLKLLELTKPSASNPDIKIWIARATELEAWVNRGGPSQADPQKPGPQRLPEVRNNPQVQGPAQRK